MMRPGKMRHKLTLQRVTRAPDEYGAEAETWADLGVIRAELVSQEAIQVEDETAGTQGRLKLVFRTWSFGGLALGDRVQWQGKALDLVQIGAADFAEARGMELTCEGAA